MFCTCLHALVGTNLWYGQHVVCFLYIYRYNNSPAAEQHIQQSVLDLPVRHQRIRCWFPLGVHRYEERWLVCLQIILSGLFPCVDPLSSSSYYRVIKKNKRGLLIRVAQLSTERKRMRHLVWIFFLPFVFPNFLSAYLALYSPMVEFF